jgi:hypothetical protein
MCVLQIFPVVVVVASSVVVLLFCLLEVEQRGVRCIVDGVGIGSRGAAMIRTV